MTGIYNDNYGGQYFPYQGQPEYAQCQVPSAAPMQGMQGAPTGQNIATGYPVQPSPMTMNGPPAQPSPVPMDGNLGPVVQEISSRGTCSRVLASTTGQSFYLKSKWRSWTPNWTLHQGPNENGTPLCKVKQEKSWGRGKFTITDLTNGSVTEVVKNGNSALNRSFQWQGRDYLWKRSSKWYKSYRYWLIPLEQKKWPQEQMTVLAEHKPAVWSGPGTTTILQPGANLPLVLVMLSAQVVEELQRQLERNTVVGAQNASMAGASVANA